MAERDAIIAGKQIYTGPMSDVSGKEVLASGQPITDAALWKMTWYVPGVITQK
jgi:basic membrane protein A and related proteins